MSKRSLIDSIEIKSPCSEDWNQMAGNERVRFCGHCKLSVNNLSTLTRKQAMRLVRESENRICVRYVVDPVDNTPLFKGKKLHRITRRAAAAAGVLSATLAFSTLAYAQGAPIPVKRRVEMQKTQKNADRDKSETRDASLSGTITDPHGAVIANAPVTIVNLQTNVSLTAKSNGEGFYKFENVAVGKYRMVISEQRGFQAYQREVEIPATGENIFDLTLEWNIETVTVGELAVIEHATPLFKAVSGGEAEQVRNLLVRGERVNGRDENYNRITPLFIAVENGSTEIAEMLLNFGARVNARDDNGETPLMRLDEDADIRLVDLLIKHGAKINLTDRQGNTPLMLAARAVKPEVLQVLLRHSANPNARNSSGRTALMEAAEADNLENVRALLVAGAEVNLKDVDGETAFDLSTDEEIQELLKEFGAEVKEDKEDSEQPR